MSIIFLLNQISLENVALDDRNHNQFADTDAIYEDIDDDIREGQVTSNASDDDIREGQVTSNASDDDIREGQVTSNASSFQGNDENLPETRFTNVAISLFQGVSRSNDMFWEFPRDWLSIERQLGEGNFGSISKAKVAPIHAMNTLKGGVVAVKTLKGL